METMERKMQVSTQAGHTITYKFDMKESLSHHIEEICKMSGEPFSTSWVLTWKENNEAPSSVIARTQQIRKLPEGVDLKLVNGQAMVYSKKRSLQAACSDASAVDSTKRELERLLPGVCAKDQVAFYWVKEDGLKLLTTAATNNVEITEMAMTVLISLLQFEPVGDAASEWFDGHMGSLDSTFFSYVLQAAGDNTIRGGAASAAALSFLLNIHPSLCLTVHNAAKGPAPGQSPDSPSLYHKLAVSLRDSNGPALLALRSMFEAAPEGAVSDTNYDFSAGGFSQDVIWEALQESFDDLGLDEDFVASLEHSLHTSSIRGETFRILAAALQENVASGVDRLRSENIDNLTRLKALEKDTKYVKNKMVSYRAQLRETLAMTRFDQFSPHLNRQLDRILKYGMKQIQWNHAYTPLHWVCEKSVDPAMVKLVALFVTELEDFDKEDDKGMRAIDYARRNQNPNIVKALRIIRDERFREAHAAITNISPQLKSIMDQVFDKGWDKIVWPKQFTAVHVAAAEGSSDSVKMLARLKADLTIVDDQGKTPLDYAKKYAEKHGNSEIVQVLEARVGAQGAYGKAPVYKAPAYGGGGQAPAYGKAGYTDAPQVDEKLTDRMRTVLQACESTGYAKIIWPRNFTALHMAAEEGSAFAVKKLLDMNASVHLNLQDDASKQTPLQFAQKRHGEKPGYERLFALLGAGPAIESPRIQEKPSEPSTQTDELAEEASPEKAPAGSMAQTAAVLAASKRLKDKLKKKKETEGLTPEEEEKYKQELKAEMDEKVQQKLEQLGEQLQDEPKVTADDINVDLLGLTALKDMYVESQARRIQLKKELEELKAGGAAALAAEQEKEESGLKGPLDEESVIKFLPKVDTGKALCIELLQADKEAGGAGLNEKEATLAYSQLEVIKRIADKYHPAAAPAPAKPSKGKGAPPPPPPSKGAGPPAPTSKGSKGPSKGPPPPASKGSKGPPPPPTKGGKGPPPPPSKGSGKGPPPPPGGKGKGPPAPGGKGAPKGMGKPAKPAERKPQIKPGARMKSLNWKKRTFGKDLPEDSIWAKVEDRTALVFSQTIADVFEDCMKTELEKRFSRDAMKVEVVKKEEEVEKKEDLTFFPSGMERIPFDMFAKGLEDRKLTPQAVCDAVENMDEITFKDNDDLKKLRELFIPDVDTKDRRKPYNSEAPQWAAMQMKREMALAKDPMTKWAPPEEYAFALNQMKCVADRLECWIFARETPGMVAFFQEKIDKFNACMDGILNSKALPTFLSLLLEVGNYLNGGNKRLGQADGFDFELDGMSADLSAIKDPNALQIGSLIWKVFIEKLPAEAEQCIEDLNPTLCNLRREIMKEGAKHPKDPKMPAPPICKRPMICIEDLETPIQALQGAVDGLVRKVPSLLTVLMQPDSAFARKFEGEAGVMQQTKYKVDQLVADLEAGKEKFENVKIYFNIKKPMESCDWFEEWDQLIVPHTLLLHGIPGAAGKKPEEILECWKPKFFSNNPLDVQAMQILYGLTTWNDIQLDIIKRKYAAKKAEQAAKEAAGGGSPKKRPERKGRGRRFGRKKEADEA